MSPLRLIYLALAALGAVVPMSFFIPWTQANGGSLRGIVAAWTLNDAASGLLWDVTIAAVAFCVWVLSEAISRRDWLGLVAIPATFGIGLSCGLPLYLFLRARRAG